MFNENIKSVAKVFYSQQLNLLIGNVQNMKIGTECIVIMGINVVVIGGAFVLAYGRIFSRQ
jgi:hypothetical protein